MRNQKNHNTEAGFVSIIVTMIIMIILTLIVLGFASLGRKEQLSALDRQLSTQAFYAAESGVNDLKAALNDPANKPYFTTNPNNTSCSSLTALTTLPGADLHPVLDATSGVQYTCVLYDTRPDSIGYPGITTNRVKLIPISNTNLSKLSINWQGQGDTVPAFRPTGSTGEFTVDDASWASDTGVLRVMIIPRDSVSRPSYLASYFNGFLYPEGTSVSAPGSVDYTTGQGTGSSGALVSGHCNTGNALPGCNVDITNLPVTAAGFFVVIHSVYATSNVSITGYNSANTKVPITGAQIVIDATGQANDVLKRIVKRIPLTSSDENFLPLGFESMDSICKQIILEPGGSPQVQDQNDCSF